MVRPHAAAVATLDVLGRRQGTGSLGADTKGGVTVSACVTVPDHVFVVAKAPTGFAAVDALDGTGTRNVRTGRNLLRHVAQRGEGNVRLHVADLATGGRRVGLGTVLTAARVKLGCRDGTVFVAQQRTASTDGCTKVVRTLVRRGPNVREALTRITTVPPGKVLRTIFRAGRRTVVALQDGTGTLEAGHGARVTLGGTGSVTTVVLDARQARRGATVRVDRTRITLARRHTGTRRVTEGTTGTRAVRLTVRLAQFTQRVKVDGSVNVSDTRTVLDAGGGTTGLDRHTRLAQQGRTRRLTGGHTVAETDRVCTVSITPVTEDTTNGVDTVKVGTGGDRRVTDTHLCLRVGRADERVQNALARRLTL